jgi:hypothetical protein
MNKTFRFFIVAFLLFITLVNKSFCQDETTYDEISINVNIQRIGSLEMSALIYGQEAYLPIKDLFDYLKIKNSISADLNTLEGFFIDPKNTYLIDYSNYNILYQGKTFKLKKNDLIFFANTLYLKSSYFEEIFGLDCIFNFRNLSISVTTKLELPAFREMKLEEMRKNMNALKGEKKADTVIRQGFPLFSLGMADWSVTTSQASGQRSNTRASFAMVAVLAGGEASINLNYDSDDPFNPRNKSYRWRYVNNDYEAIRQITIGRIYPRTTANIYDPVFGLQLTNTPTTYKKSFGTYRISDHTEPEWSVELYVNNVLVNFIKADASGFYSFDVPLVYGNSSITLRFYGPWGEERTQEQNINIPFTLLPAGQFEYNMSAGVVQAYQQSGFYRLDLNYGLNNRITIGGGAEYLSSVNNHHPMPFINTAIRVSSNLLLSGEYTNGVNAKGMLNYRLPGNMQLDLNYIKYEKEQTAIMFNYLEERKLSLSMPIKAHGFSAYSRLSLNQLLLPNQKNIRAELLISAFLAGVSSNLTTYGLLNDFSSPYLYSNLSLTFRLPMAIRFTPHIQYEYRSKSLNMMKAEVEKRLGNLGFASLAYEESLVNHYSAVNFGLRMNFSFMQTSFSVMKANGRTITSQAARGSIQYNDQSNQVFLSKDSNLGKGGFTIVSFLDLNYNGKHDKNEPKVGGLKLKVNSGRISKNKRDTTISVNGLEAYTKSILELDPNSFDNISWQLKNKIISATVEPGHFKLIEVPITVAGEVLGYVHNKSGAGMGQIIVNFYNRNSELIAKTVTEEDGYFTFMGLPPGSYTARIDQVQLKKIKMKSTSVIPFNIAANTEGDIVDSVNLILQKEGE